MLAPITPFTVEDVFAHYEKKEGGTFLERGYYDDSEIRHWEQPNLEKIASFLISIRNYWLQAAAPTDSTNYQMSLIFHDKAIFDEMTSFVAGCNTGSTTDISLQNFATELFHVARLDFEGLTLFDKSIVGTSAYGDEMTDYTLSWKSLTADAKCERCRKFLRLAGHDLCDRCNHVVSKVE